MSASNYVSPAAAPRPARRSIYTDLLHGSEEVVTRSAVRQGLRRSPSIGADTQQRVETVEDAMRELRDEIDDVNGTNHDDGAVGGYHAPSIGHKGTQIGDWDVEQTLAFLVDLQVPSEGLEYTEQYRIDGCALAELIMDDDAHEILENSMKVEDKTIRIRIIAHVKKLRASEQRENQAAAGAVLHKRMRWPEA